MKNIFIANFDVTVTFQNIAAGTLSFPIAHSTHIFAFVTSKPAVLLRWYTLEMPIKLAIKTKIHMKTLIYCVFVDERCMKYLR